MGTFIATILIIYQIRLAIKRKYENAIIFYLLSSFLSPYFRIGSMAISYEIVGFFVVLFQVIIMRNPSVQRIEIHDLWLVALVLEDVVLSVISTLYYNLKMPFIALFALFRYLTIFIVLRKISWIDRIGTLKKMLDYTLVINFVFSFVQISVPSSVVFFTALYGKETNAVLSGFANLGYFNRAVGSFGSPAIVGPFALCCLAFYFSLFLEGRRFNIIDLGLKILLSLGLGTLALSKAFIIGAPIIFVVCVLLHLGTINVKNFFRFITIIIVVVGVSGIAVSIIIEHTSITNNLLDYYFDFLLNPIQAFTTRFSQAGNTVDAFNVFKEHILFGVGVGSISGEFIGDSTYINLLHNTGLFGISCVFLYLIYAINIFRNNNNRIGLSLVLAILLGGIGIPLFTELFAISIIGLLFFYSDEGEHQALGTA